MIPMTNFTKLAPSKPSEFDSEYARCQVRHTDFLVFVQLPAGRYPTHTPPAVPGLQT